jgi:hypothetical protein
VLGSVGRITGIDERFGSALIVAYIAESLARQGDYASDFKESGLVK